MKKLRKYGYEISIENMVNMSMILPGVRLICSFTSDIYQLAEMIGNQSDLKVLSIKDYIKNPKESGYKSYHMLVSVLDLSVRQCGGYKSRDSDQDNCDGFLGQPGTQDLL